MEWAISEQETDGVVIRGSLVLHSMVSVSVKFDNSEVHEHLRVLLGFDDDKITGLA